MTPDETTRAHTHSCLILAIDTTSKRGSIALADSTGILEEAPLQSREGYGHILFPEIEALLKRHNLHLADIHIFAAASGPGSFTGVRVGLAAIKGLAEVQGQKVVAVSSLAAIAAFGQTGERAVVIDAHRGEIYGAVYDRNGSRLFQEVVLPMTTFLNRIPPTTTEWVTQNPPAEISAAAPAHFTQTEAPNQLAGAVARIALRSTPVDPAAVEANYVRRSDAELLWKEA